MAVHVAGALGRILASGLQRAQGGEPQLVVTELEGALEDLPPVASHERAAALYVLAVALLLAEAPERAIRTSTASVRDGEELGEPGWVANALTIRAVALERLGRAAEAVDDLVRAEWEAQCADDDGLVAWAHAGLGTAYEELRLFELAVPHYRQCATLGCDPIDFPGSALIDELSLASLHGTWARELEMLGTASARARRDIVRQREQAVTHATRAIDLHTPETTAHLALQARLLRAQNAWHHDPEAWVDELIGLRQEFTEHEDDPHTVECTATLAAVLAAAGRFEQAAEEADRAVDVLGIGSESALDRFVRWVALTVEDARGERSAASGLVFGATVARGWWAHRENKLEMMRAAIAGYARYRTSESDRQAARQDPLTGLGNRRAFDEWLESTHDVGDSTLVLIDVDRLKVVNDTHGHAAGDDLLVAVARLLRAHTREPDLTLRLGGDEFVVVIRDAAVDDGDRVGDRLRSALVSLSDDASRPFMAEVAASMGVASTHEGLDVDELLPAADQRMYEDKRRRRREREDLAVL